MTNPNSVLEDLEQHSIAIEVMHDVTARARDQTGSLDRMKAATLLREAAIDRKRQGHLRAAQLLSEWAEKMGKPAGEWD